MKLGFSYSRCLRDLIEGTVDFVDVVAIITRTDFDPRDDAHWKSIWLGYTHGGASYAEWANFDHLEDEFRDMTLRLYDAGKLHQPRQYGAHPQRMKDPWYDLIVTPDNTNPAVEKAYEKYKLLAGLAK